MMWPSLSIINATGNQVFFSPDPTNDSETSNSEFILTNQIMFEGKTIKQTKQDLQKLDLHSLSNW